MTDGVTLIKSLKALVFATLFKSCLEKLSLVVDSKLQIQELKRFRDNPMTSSDNFFHLSDFRKFLQNRQLRRVNLELERLGLHLELDVGALGRVKSLNRDSLT